MALQIDRMCDRCRGPYILLRSKAGATVCRCRPIFSKNEIRLDDGGRLVRLRSGRANIFAGQGKHFCCRSNSISIITLVGMYGWL